MDYKKLRQKQQERNERWAKYGSYEDRCKYTAIMGGYIADCGHVQLDGKGKGLRCPQCKRLKEFDYNLNR